MIVKMFMFINCAEQVPMIMPDISACSGGGVAPGVSSNATSGMEQRLIAAMEAMQTKSTQDMQEFMKIMGMSQTKTNERFEALDKANERLPELIEEILDKREAARGPVQKHADIEHQSTVASSVGSGKFAQIARAMQDTCLWC